MKKLLLVLFGAATIAALSLFGWYWQKGNVGEPTAVTAPPVSPTDNPVFQLTAGTVATFEINEELRGTPRTVVATTAEVLGEISFDPSDLTTAEIGTILINARTFGTDSGNRDRAIKGLILDSGTFEFIEFAPKRIEGLSGAAADGAEIAFSVVGDLKIRDISTEVSFEVVAKFGGDSLTGAAETTVNRAAYNLTIPNVTGVANVSEEVVLTLEFVASRVR